MREIEGFARVNIHEGQVEEYKRLTSKCMELARTKDTGTLQYDIFLNSEGTEAIVHERYRDSDALLQHTANLGELMNQIMQVSTISGEVLGQPTPVLRKMLDQYGVRVYEPYLSL